MFNKNKWNIFIKLVIGGKLFTGCVIKTSNDFRQCVGTDFNIEIWCSELISLKSKYRCFIRYGKILDIKNYKGDPLLVPNKVVLDNIIKEYKHAPNAYTIDLSIDENNNTHLIEVNEGYSVGSYGLNHIQYAKFLATRWAELTNSEDEYKYF